MRFYVKKPSRRQIAFVGLIFALGYGAIIYSAYVRRPKFLSSIKDSLVNNLALMTLIGGESGSQIYWSEDDAMQKEFVITIFGECHDAKVLVSGKFSDSTYEVQDTLIVRCTYIE